MAALNRYYHPTKFESRSVFLTQGVKCVFISYQQADRQQAIKVAEYLQNAGVDVYFDIYDNELKISHQNNDPKRVTNAICKGINNSSHMVVVVSPNTVFSTWVPFEIGYGFEKTDLAVLCLKGIPKGTLPEYIRTVPIIRDIYDLNNKISSLRNLSSDILLESKSINRYDNFSNPLRDVMDSIISDT